MSTLYKTVLPAPILNTPDFEKVFGAKTLPLDDQELLRQVEFIALCAAVFEEIERKGNIVKLQTPHYPDGPLYGDVRFFELTLQKEQPRILPKKEQILANLKGALGKPYIWGGNYSKGISQIKQWYQSTIPKALEDLWLLRGVDCSGLLYEATNGYTGRNTGQLCLFGQEVSLQNVKPLDIVVWPGHVLIFLGPNELIESCYGRGVVTSCATKRLKEIENIPYQIRRFY